MTTLAQAEAMDAADLLRPFRDRFALPAGLIYLDGNSLGPLPAQTPAIVADAVARQWGERLIASWNEAGWIDAPLRVGAAIAGLIGATPDEVLVADSTSVNLFKLLVATLEGTSGGGVLVEAGDFPTDLHVAARAAAIAGRPVLAVAADDVLSAFEADVAVAVLSHVHYRSGRRRDMAAVNAAAERAGVRVIWDLSHAAGAVPLDLQAAGVALAVGCGYKYLNGGPGAPAFLYVRRDLQPALVSPIAGWLGHARPFAFEDGYAPAPGIARFQAGTPPMLSLLALEAGVRLMAEADMAALWAKSCRLFDLFDHEMAAHAPAMMLVTPREPEARGSHASFRHPHAFEIVQALIARGVVGDFRAPDIARFGLTPLFVGFADVWRAANTLAAVLREEAWRDPCFAVRATVT